MEQNLNQPQVGMSMKNPSLLKEGEYPLAVNAILQSANGNFAMLSNDHSNILASKFKEGFKVIGTNLVPSLNLTFFFLVNPSTGESEIGYIFDTENQDKPDSYSQCADCDYQIVEDTPLEQTTQTPLSLYYTFVNADCLNFSIDNPVTSWVKIDDCNIRIYFNDFKNPPRYIDYKDFQKVALQNCPLIESNELDCDKILIFPETCYPTLEVVDIISGGQNTAGVYQFAICYSDANANKLTDYYYVSNPTPLYDQPIISNANTAYPVAKSFKLQITNLNTDFRYFNLAVLKTINNVTSVFLVETFDIKSNYFEYVYTGVDKNLQQDLSIDEIIAKRPYYNKARITTDSNGYLFLADLAEDRVLNLQPVVSTIPVYWQTVEMDEGSYANPIIAQNYVGYLGDEVYPFGIAFTKKNGKQTSVFPFVGREATPSDLAPVDPDYIADIIGSSACSTGNPPSAEWQVYNTAEKIDDVYCLTEAFPNQTPIDITDDIECYSNPIWFTEQNGAYVYYYPPTGTTTPPIVYPPTTSDEALALEAYLGIPGNSFNSLNSPTVQTNIGLCDCQTDIANSYPPSSNPQVQSSFVEPVPEEINSEETFTINNYSPETLIPFQNLPGQYGAPTNSQIYPDPCKNFANNEKDSTEGFQAWIDQKENTDYLNAASIIQSDSTNCQIKTWGSFLGGTDSWYQFYITNKDRVVGITLNTNRTNCLLEGSNNANLEIAVLNSTNTIVTIPPSFYQKQCNNNGCFIFLKVSDLQIFEPSFNITKPVYIKVTGNYSAPGGVARECCKQRTFSICVNTPRPLSTRVFTIPASGTIVKTCKIKYQGVPQNSCKPLAKEYGKFAYWESQETYPCNQYVWGDLAGKPIRHFKFPDNKTVKFFEEKGAFANKLSLKANKIYPKGIRISIENIKAALNNAVSKGLITEKEKDELCGYRIYRGNRRGNQSIIAKGLLYDVWEYTDNIYGTGNKVLFPNFPFNDNNPNKYIKTKKIRSNTNLGDENLLIHPFAGQQNNKYTFDAPNLSFNNPGLGTEIKLEGEQSGKVVYNFVDVKNNTEYQYLGAGVISAAVGFASLEAAFEASSVVATATLTLSIQVLGSGTDFPLGLVLAVISENFIAPLRIYSHYTEWYDIIKKFAPFRNYAVYYTGVGKYVNNAEGNVVKGNTRRTVANAQYLKAGMLNVNTTKGSTRFNNFKRESSVFIELANNSFFTKTLGADTSRGELPSCDNPTIGRTADVCSYYGSLKNPLLSQYGQIDNIEWIDTGYNGRIEWNNVEQNTDCDTIFGGDTYINRFTKKRKIPMFLQDQVIPSSVQVAPQNTDIQLSLLPNVGYPRFFMNYPTSFDYSDGGNVYGLFGDVAVQLKNKVDFNFFCKGDSGRSWQDAGTITGVLASLGGSAWGIIGLPVSVGVMIGLTRSKLGNDIFISGKYIHSFYGISSFLCESDYNLDYRHGENNKEKDFYPNVGDTIEWTQEYNVPMYYDNYYLYNNDYSRQNLFNPNFVLNNDYNPETAECESYHPNRLIYSLQDNDQNSKFDGNLIFLANNRFEFSKAGGKLIMVKGIENGKVLVIQENRSSIFNSFIALETNVATASVGSNTLFNQQAPTLFMQTDLGFGGAQTPAFVSTEFGSYWVDNKRGQILNKTDSIQNIVKPEEEWWFKENLPFKIIKDFPKYSIINNFKNVGMAITYDARYKRVIFTKKDYELKPEYRGLVQYNDATLEFTYKGTIIQITDPTYFCNKSWTISYHPLFKNFVSFHSFIPNYYVSNQSYFASGVNFANDPSEEGLWYHNLTNKSFQVYYGKLQPFIFEFSIGSKYQNKILESVQYISEFYRFQNNLSSAFVPNKTYNKALIYNQNQSTGLLELVPTEKNNRMQFVQYPKQKFESREILVENIENLWRFNNFFNVAQSNGQPMMTFDCNSISYRNINPLAIKYNTKYLKDLMRSDYHVIRLINDKYSNYNILQRFSITKTNNSIS